MSGTNQLGLPVQGNNIPTPAQPRGSQPGRISLRGPSVPQMQSMVSQPPPMAGPAAAGPAPAGATMAPAKTSGGIGDLPDSFNNSRNTLMQEFGRAKAAYADTKKALKGVDLVRKGLEHLSDKQDMVTMEDIISEAGKLVAHGLDPVALAGVLASAPVNGGGEALGGWIASHAQAAMRGEQALLAQHNLNRYQVSVAGIHLLMAHANAQKMTGMVPPMGKVPDGNELTPGSADDDDSDPGTGMNAAMQIGQRFMNGDK
jgi:hypothetical protein